MTDLFIARPRGEQNLVVGRPLPAAANRVLYGENGLGPGPRDTAISMEAVIDNGLNAAQMKVESFKLQKELNRVGAVMA